MNKLNTYLFHSFSLLELNYFWGAAAHQRLLLGLKQCGESWSSVIVSPYMALVLGSSFSNMSKSLWFNLPHGSTYSALSYHLHYNTLQNSSHFMSVTMTGVLSLSDIDHSSLQNMLIYVHNTTLSLVLIIISVIVGFLPITKPSKHVARMHYNFKGLHVLKITSFSDSSSLFSLTIMYSGSTIIITVQHKNDKRTTQPSGHASHFQDQHCKTHHKSCLWQQPGFCHCLTMITGYYKTC